MTLSTIRTMVTNFLKMDLDHYIGESPTASELTDSVNWAIRLVSAYTWCNYDHKITLTLTAGTHVYDCRDVTAPVVVTRKVLYPRLVTIDSTVLRQPNGEPGLWSLRDLEAYHSGYQTYDNNVPRRAVWLPGNKLLLSPPPDTATAAQTDHFISGVYLAADLVNSTDDSNPPDIPEEGHEALAALAAVKVAIPNVSEAEGWQRLKEFSNSYYEWANDERARNRNLVLGPSSVRGQRSDWMREGLWV